MPHQFDKEFSWKKHLEDIDEDIAIARNAELEIIEQNLKTR